MDLLAKLDWDNLPVDYLLTQSYKDFHAKGLDYVCLKRTPELTLKAYFFADGMESQKVGEVINPHDHRYDFDTQTFSGTIENRVYRVPPCWDGVSRDIHECGTPYDWYLYWTPLNHGKSGGFAFVNEVPLQMSSRVQYPAGQRYYMGFNQLHTIRVVERETCIVLAQYEDRLPLDRPTNTLTSVKEPPSMAGLYSHFTADQYLARINLLRDLQRAL